MLKFCRPGLVSAQRERRRRPSLVVLGCALLAGAWGTAEAMGTSSDNGESILLFAQVGAAESATRSYVLGGARQWPWRRTFGLATVTGYSEVAVGRWSTVTNGRRSYSWATQLGLTPVLRLQSRRSLSGWFLELGIGGNMILPLYRSSNKRFSTEFNFGDHLGIGRSLGSGARQELALRVQHLSNAGIRHPNPGENFFQLRYSYRLHGRPKD